MAVRQLEPWPFSHFNHASQLMRLWHISSSVNSFLKRWAYSIPMVRRPSVVVVRRPHFQTWISLKSVGQSWSNFMCSITGVGERLHKVLGQIGSKNSGFHGNRKPPLTYNGENDVSTVSQLFFIRSCLFLQVTRTCIKSWTSSNFGQIRPLTTELAALECLKNSP